jgi:hypothetical protein
VNTQGPLGTLHSDHTSQKRVQPVQARALNKQNQLTDSTRLAMAMTMAMTATRRKGSPTASTSFHGPLQNQVCAESLHQLASLGRKRGDEHCQAATRLCLLSTIRRQEDPQSPFECSAGAKPAQPHVTMSAAANGSDDNHGDSKPAHSSKLSWFACLLLHGLDHGDLLTQFECLD